MPHSASTTITDPIFSRLEGDEIIRDIVELFVQEMPDRVETLTTCAREERWDDLHTAAHQLKGSAGSYGFDSISKLAEELDAVVRRDGDPREIETRLAPLVDACTRVRFGKPAE